MVRSEHHYHPIYTRQITIPDKAWRRVALPYAMTIAHDDENGYVAEVGEFPWLMAEEETRESAETTLRDSIALAIASTMRRGHPISEPHRVTA